MSDVQWGKNWTIQRHPDIQIKPDGKLVRLGELGFQQDVYEEAMKSPLNNTNASDLSGEEHE